MLEPCYSVLDIKIFVQNDVLHFQLTLSSLVGAKWATSWENLFIPYANDKGASAFVVYCLNSIILAKFIQSLSPAEQAGLSLTWSQIPFLMTCLWHQTWGRNLLMMWELTEMVLHVGYVTHTCSAAWNFCMNSIFLQLPYVKHSHIKSFLITVIYMVPSCSWKVHMMPLDFTCICQWNR